MNLLGDNINIYTRKKNTETLIDASKEVGLEVNTEKFRYMLPSHQQNAWRTHDINIADSSFESVAQLKYFGTAVGYQHLTQEEIKRRLNSGNACYHSL
jgi:hypothetical protein